MNNQYTISQLAKSAEVPVTTVRYYERIGLVEPEDRSQGNYRLYSDVSLNKLKFAEELGRELAPAAPRTQRGPLYGVSDSAVR